MRLRRSLLLLGAVVAVALIGLSIDGNWPKVLRVGAAAGTYAGMMLVLARSHAPGRAIEWWRFAAAGTAAGIVSGLLRPALGGATIAVDAVAAVVLATVHWGGLALSERLRRTIVA
jgi:hypothetical protein